MQSSNMTLSYLLETLIVSRKSKVQNRVNFAYKAANIYPIAWYHIAKECCILCLLPDPSAWKSLPTLRHCQFWVDQLQ